MLAQLQLKGTRLNTSPIKQVLGAIGIRSAMTTAFTECESIISEAAANHLLTTNPLWIVIESRDGLSLLRAADLALALEILKEDSDVIRNYPAAIDHEITIDLLEIPAQRFDILPISELASLFEAKQILDSQPGCALVVTPQVQVTSVSNKLGLITQDNINNYYI